MRLPEEIGIGNLILQRLQFGRALKVLKELGIRLVMDVPDSLGPELRESISLAEAAAKARADAAEASKKAIE